MKYVLTYLIVILSFIISTSVWSTCPAPSESNVQLQILGSGGPAASSGRASASYILWVDGVSRIMVDTGSGTKDQFHLSGANLDDIEIIAISHLHPDHSVELPAILWPIGGSFKISGPTGSDRYPSIEGFLDLLFGPSGAFNVLAERIELETITVDVTSADPIEVWREDNILVQGIGVPHSDTPTIGYRFDLGDRSIAFASDQNGSNPSFIDFIRDVDVLVVHLGGTEDQTGRFIGLHAKPSVWGKMATAANVGQVVVSHISTSSAQMLNTSLEFLRENYSGPLTVGEDLMCIEVK